MKKNKLIIFSILVILGLLVLWLRENEMRVKAESGYANIKDKATSVINEKGEAIADLSTQVGEMQAHIQQKSEDFAGTLGEKDAEIVKIKEDTRIATAENEATVFEKNKNITDLEAEIKQTTEKYDTALKKKNKELSEMGEELRKTTERLALALKDKEIAESQSYDSAQKTAQAAKKITKLADDNRRLEALSKACAQQTQVPDTAEGTAKAA